MKRLIAGQIIKLRIHTMSGWKGYGRLIRDEDEGGTLAFDKLPDNGAFVLGPCFCMRHEAIACRNPPAEIVRWATDCQQKRATHEPPPQSPKHTRYLSMPSLRCCETAGSLLRGS